MPLPSEMTPGPDHAARYEVVNDSVVEPKTKAATAGAGAGAIVSAFVLWLLDELIWDGADNPPEVPLPVSALVALIVTGAVTFISSYYARHVNREN